MHAPHHDSLTPDMRVIAIRLIIAVQEGSFFSNLGRTTPSTSPACSGSRHNSLMSSEVRPCVSFSCLFSCLLHLLACLPRARMRCCCYRLLLLCLPCLCIYVLYVYFLVRPQIVLQESFLPSTSLRACGPSRVLSTHLWYIPVRAAARLKVRRMTPSSELGGPRTRSPTSQRPTSPRLMSPPSRR